MLSITKLSLFYGPCCDCSPARSTLETMDHFPALKEVKIRLQDPKAKKWKKFLGVASGRLQRMKKFVLKNHVGRSGVRGLDRMWSGSLSTDEDLCLRAYRGPFLKQQDLWQKQRVKWEFEREMNEFRRRRHGVLGILNIVVE